MNYITHCPHCHGSLVSEPKADDRQMLLTVSDITAKAAIYRRAKKEYLIAFLLDVRHRIIRKETISIGTLTASLAHPREIFAPAIKRAAAAIILVHNHPSGDPTPSAEDQNLTKRVREAGRIIGIDLLDHIIVAKNGAYSFKSAGAL